VVILRRCESLCQLGLAPDVVLLTTHVIGHITLTNGAGQQRAMSKTAYSTEDGVHTSFAISVSVGLACRGCSPFECLKCVGQFESGRMQAPFSGLERRLN
jgi:hypothetical protein